MQNEKPWGADFRKRTATTPSLTREIPRRRQLDQSTCFLQAAQLALCHEIPNNFHEENQQYRYCNGARDSTPVLGKTMRPQIVADHIEQASQKAEKYNYLAMDQKHDQRR